MTGGLFDKRNEGSFFTCGFRLHGYVYPRHCRKRAIVLHYTQHFELAFAAQQNDLRTFNQAFLPRKARNESGTPPQCLRVIDQKWLLVVELIDLDRFSKK